MMIGALVLIGLAGLICFMRSQYAPSQSLDGNLQNDQPTVRAGGETLIGQKLDNGIFAFLGVPFAAAPVGDLRWEAAVKHVARTGPQSATSYGAACPQSQGNPDWYRQIATGFGNDPDLIADLDQIDEDCLYLNVWTPNLTGGEKLPVMIWVHGGSNVNGWAYEPNYIGDKLAAKNVVVISVQYRLGAFGFLPLPFAKDGIGEEGHVGNYGLSDLIAAIQWSRDNAANFGGDSGNITVFGESSGGGNIAALLQSPLTKGLFHKAIIQSGALGKDSSLPLEIVMARSAKMFEAISVQSLQQARALEWEDLVDLHKKTGVSHYFGPVMDDVYVRGDGALNANVGVMIGSNRNEMLMYLDGGNPDLVADNIAAFPAKYHAAIYDLLKAGNLSSLEQADYLSTAFEFHCPAVLIAGKIARTRNNVFVYRFARKRENKRDGQQIDLFGAYHGAEIPYVFNTHDDWLPTNETDHVLTQVMMDYWVNFAKTGNPNQDGLANWPSHVPQTNRLQTLGDKIETTADFSFQLCNFLHDKDDF